jgi:beta-phosphoglucomutase
LIKACIFDLDGVLVDTAHYHYLAWKRLAKEFDYELTVEINEQLKGVSRMKSLEILLSLGGDLHYDERAKERLAARKNEWFVEYITHMNRDEIFPGVEDLIIELRHENIRIGLASSSRNAQQVIQSLGIAGLFDAIVDGTMVTHAKPDPEVFMLAAGMLEVAVGQCVVFEDAAAGVQAALAAGMKCVGVGSEEQLGEADVVVARTGDIGIRALRAL